MEVSPFKSWSERVRGYFYQEPMPLQARRDLHWKRIIKMGAAAIGAFVFWVLLMPSPVPEATTFHERADPGSTSQKTVNQESDTTQETLAQLQASRANANVAPSSLAPLYPPLGGGVGSGERDRSASMVLVRGGQDSRSQLPPGSRVRVRLTQSVIVSGQAMPVMGIVAGDVTHENSIAIPEGTKVLGEVAFDSTADRAQVTWRSMIFPNGRERPVQAMGIGLDGKMGIEGEIHSEAVKNVIGQALTRFIGAYAEGSMTQGAFGASEGGNANGFKNAVAETAKDRAEAWGEDMKQQKRWIELQAGLDSFAVLGQPLVFRDPGAIYGQ